MEKISSFFPDFSLFFLDNSVNFLDILRHFFDVVDVAVIALGVQQFGRASRPRA
jgi:hypothetical protein